MGQLSSDAKNLPPVVERIYEMFNHYGLNASSATRKLGYNTTSKLYKILQGSEPSLPTLVDFLNHWPEVSSDWLVLGKGPMLREASDAVASSRQAWSPGLAGTDNLRVLTVTVDLDGEENISLVPVPAQAGYTKHYNEAVYLQQLRHYRIPGFESGTYRAFEVDGDSMEPTLNHRDVVVTSFVDELRLLVPGDVYVIVTPESVLLKRIKDRVRDTDEEITLYSDNPLLKTFGVETRDIVQIWRVRGYVSSYIPSAPDVTVERLKEIIEALDLDKGEVRRHLQENATSHATL